MGANDDISGGPPKQAGRGPAPKAIVRGRSRTLRVANDNGQRRQDHVAPGGAMRDPGVKLAVLRKLGELMRRLLHLEGRVTGLGRRGAPGALPPADRGALDGVGARCGAAGAR